MSKQWTRRKAENLLGSSRRWDSNGDLITQHIPECVHMYEKDYSRLKTFAHLQPSQYAFLWSEDARDFSGMWKPRYTWKSLELRRCSCAHTQTHQQKVETAVALRTIWLTFTWMLSYAVTRTKPGKEGLNTKIRTNNWADTSATIHCWGDRVHKQNNNNNG